MDFKSTRRGREPSVMRKRHQSLVPKVRVDTQFSFEKIRSQGLDSGK